LAFQTWTWDTAGRVTEHAVASGDATMGVAETTAARLPVVSHRYQRAFDGDADGRLLRDAEIVVSADGRESVAENVRSYDGTRLVRETRPGDDITYTYDSAGRLSEEVHRLSYAQEPPVEAVQRVTYAYDADGRLVHTEDRLSGDYPRNVSETRAYACEAR
jgi:YD repeat-containing protein